MRIRRYSKICTGLTSSKHVLRILRRQLQKANADDHDVDEIVTYVEEERQLRREREERRRRHEKRQNALAWKRAKWWLLGYPDERDD